MVPMSSDAVPQRISKTFSATLGADPSYSIMKVLTSIHSFLQLYLFVQKDCPYRLYYVAALARHTFNPDFVGHPLKHKGMNRG